MRYSYTPLVKNNIAREYYQRKKKRYELFILVPQKNTIKRIKQNVALATAALVYTTDFHVELKKPSFVVQPVTHAPVILSSSYHSTVPRSPQTMECDPGSNWQVPTPP